MRQAARMISATLALALVGVAVVVVVEAAAALVGAAPQVIPAERWLREGRATGWDDFAVRLALSGLLLGGLGLVAFALWPRRMYALDTAGDGSGIELFVERRSLERSIAGRIERLDGVRSSEARVGKRRVVVDVRAVARADGVEERARQSVADSLDTYEIDLSDRITINLRKRAA